MSFQYRPHCNPAGKSTTSTAKRHPQRKKWSFHTRSQVIEILLKPDTALALNLRDRKFCAFSVPRRDSGTMQNVTTRETPQGGGTNKRDFPQSFTSRIPSWHEKTKLCWFWRDLNWERFNEKHWCGSGSPDVRRVSAKRQLTVDTVPVTLLDVHLECDKVDLIIFF